MEIHLESQEQEMKYQSQIWNQICGTVDTSVLRCAIQLGIFDAIHNSGKPMITLTELSSIVSSPSSSSIEPCNLYRLMRYLSQMDLISIGECLNEATVSLTGTSKLLLRNQEKSLIDWVLAISCEMMVVVWHELSSSVSTPADEPPIFQKVHGKNALELAGEFPEWNDLINNAMTSDTSVTKPALIQGCGKILNGVTSLIDVGGGHGATMAYIVEAFPHIKGAVIDLPHVVEAAPERPGVEFISGDIFKSISNADAVLLKYVLHNWEDTECVNLLKRCKEAVPADKGKVIIMDLVIDDDDNSILTQAKLSLDLTVMNHGGGRERTKEDWRNLIEMSGFSRHEIIPISAMPSIIVAYP